VTSPDAGRLAVERPIGRAAGPGPCQPARHGKAAAIPAYLREVYGWAYLNRTNARLLDRDAVVSAILLGNNRRLRRAGGQLDVIDLVPLQAALCRRKLRGFPQARVRIADAAQPGDGVYDVITCFFLLHEIPDERKRAVVDALLARVVPGGKVVFVDYHTPARWHPLRGLMRLVMGRLEPFEPLAP
jgi:SAM-dependent methyltransferase